MTERLDIAPPAPALPAPVEQIRAIGGAEVPFVVSSWTQSHMRSPGQPWGDLYRRHVLPTIERLLRREDVWMLGAFGPFEGKPDRILGWIAWTPGDLPAIHYAFVRGPLRKRGVLTALMREAMLGRRMIHTYRGQLPKVGRRKISYDKKVVEALLQRGVSAVYIPIEEWMETVR